MYCDAIQDKECNIWGGDWQGNLTFKSACKICERESQKMWNSHKESLIKLSDFIEFSLDYLQLSYEVLYEDRLIKYIDLSTGETFIESDAKKFRKYDLIGIQGDNSKLITATGWKPKLNLEDISKKMIDYELEVKNRK